MRKAFIAGLAGPSLLDDEHAFLAETRPAGIILFARNCASPDQLRRLIQQARSAIGCTDVLVLIDQEGGRVRRLKPPYWREQPAAAAFARLYQLDRVRGLLIARLAAQLIAQDLRAVGINTNCAPVLDLAVPGAHAIIGDRAYGQTPQAVAELGRAVAEGYLAGGVLPIIKHIPGHGRALVDSHEALPEVREARSVLGETDFAAFRALADLPAAMTAHIIYHAVDPSQPASTSPRVTAEVIRAEIGFDGLLISDDIGMRALSGDFAGRARAVIAAGSDIVLHCSGCLSEARAVSAAVPALFGKALSRFNRAIEACADPRSFDVAEAEAAMCAALEHRAFHRDRSNSD